MPLAESRQRTQGKNRLRWVIRTYSSEESMSLSNRERITDGDFLTEGQLGGAAHREAWRREWKGSHVGP